MTDSEALAKGAELMEWVRSSQDARLAVRGVCMSYGVETLGQLAVENPEAFELLHQSIKDMQEQIPIYWTP